MLAMVPPLQVKLMALRCPGGGSHHPPDTQVHALQAVIASMRGVDGMKRSSGRWRSGTPLTPGVVGGYREAVCALGRAVVLACCQYRPHDGLAASHRAIIQIAAAASTSAQPDARCAASTASACELFGADVRARYLRQRAPGQAQRQLWFYHTATHTEAGAPVRGNVPTGWPRVDSTTRQRGSLIYVSRWLRLRRARQIEPTMAVSGRRLPGAGAEGGVVRCRVASTARVPSRRSSITGGAAAGCARGWSAGL